MTRPKTVGDVLDQARAPYSHMSEKDARLFYSTLNALLVYANERLHVVAPDLLRQRPGAPCMLYENGGQVSDALWQNRALVEDFVRDNPMGLAPRQVQVARPWRYALRDMFTCVDANADRAVYMNRDRLFVVGALQDDADAHVHNIPSLMLLTLLPFKGGIVTDGKTLHLSPRPHDWAVPLIGEELAYLASRRPVATAAQLRAYGRGVRDDENRLAGHFQHELDRGFASGALV